MRKLIILGLILLLLCLPVHATEELGVETDGLQEGLSGEAQELMPEIEPGGQSDFWEGLKELFLNAWDKASGSFRDGIRLCALLLCVVTLCAVVDMSSVKNGGLIIKAAGALGICAAMIGAFESMISMAAATVQEISTYSSFLLPVLASASAMSGGVTSASALYVGTILFSQILLQLISKLLIPAVYFYLAICTAEAAISSDMLSELREFIGWVISKSLRVLLYLFIAYMSITGVISGTTDAAAVKATKAAVSGMIPVVGNIISDASESLLASASLLKNSAGIFGMLAVLAICLLPVIKTGLHYLLLKITAAVSGAIGIKSHVNLLKHFSVAMGYLLAMCGTGGLLMLISTVCFMRAVG